MRKKSGWVMPLRSTPQQHSSVMNSSATSCHSASTSIEATIKGLSGSASVIPLTVSATCTCASAASERDRSA